MLGSAVEPVTTATLPENGRLPSMERRPLLFSSGVSATPMPASVSHVASRVPNRWILPGFGEMLRSTVRQNRRVQHGLHDRSCDTCAGA